MNTTLIVLFINRKIVCLFVSCRPTFYRIIKKKSVEEFQPYPYLGTTINCLFWVLYGTPFIHPGSTLVLTTNGIGLVIELIYLFIFFLYAKDNKQRVRTLHTLLSSIASCLVHINRSISLLELLNLLTLVRICILQKLVAGVFLLELVIIALVTGLVIGKVPTIKERTLIIGIICIIFNIGMYFSPLIVAVSVSICLEGVVYD